jgi:hypothetical protein
MAALPQPRRQAGVSVFGVLAGAAVLGAATGLALASRAPNPDADLDTVERASAKALPGGAPMSGQRPDIMDADPLSLRGLPAYPGAQPRRITSSAAHLGQVNAISWFSTQDSLDRVLSFYDETWVAQNRMHVSHRWPRRGYVSWFEQRPNPDGGMAVFGDGVLHMVSAMDEGSQTIVLLSATEPQRLLEAMSPLPPGVRLPAAAGRPQVLHTGEVGEERVSIFARVPRPRDEVADEVVEGLRGEGWTVTERVAAPNGAVSITARQGSRLQLVGIDGAGRESQVLIALEPLPQGDSAP